MATDYFALAVELALDVWRPAEGGRVMTSRPWQHLTNRDLLDRWADAWPAQDATFEALNLEVMHRPSETCEEGTVADQDLTGFDQPDTGYAGPVGFTAAVFNRMLGSTG